MYRPEVHAVDDAAGWWQLLAGCRAGHLVTAVGALDATFLPFLVDVDGSRILAHVARANPQWRAADGTSALLIAGVVAGLSRGDATERAVAADMLD